MPISNTEPKITSQFQQETSDLHSASDEYAKRFSSSSGQWMLELQGQVVNKLLSNFLATNKISAQKSPSLLDVGGGHGQIIKVLNPNTYDLTVLASSDQAAKQIEPELKAGTCKLKVGSLLEIPFADQSFNFTSCFRILAHCDQWPLLIKELCRATENAVIVDYPLWYSFNLLEPLLFSFKKAYEGNTRSFILFYQSQIVAEFAKNSFVLDNSYKQFFWPMVVHRALENPKLSSGLEGVAGILGIKKLFGSPIISLFRRV